MGGWGLISPPFQVVFEVGVQEQVHGKVENLSSSVPVLRASLHFASELSPSVCIYTANTANVSRR